MRKSSQKQKRNIALLRRGVFGVVISLAAGLTSAAQSVGPGTAGQDPRALTLSWDKEFLTIRGQHLPGGALEVWYIEAFCRPASTRRDWKETVIPHITERVEAAGDGRLLRLRSRLKDGVVVDHVIRAGRDEVDFQLVATNPTAVESQAHWAQPCIRVDRYAGVKPERASEAYLPHCFIDIDGKLARMPTVPWAKTALYTPGQVWCPRGVSRDDVNPRPLSPIVPSDGLIGCVSADGKEMIATAWEPYQELFQGVIVCLHSDFRIGGLKPGQSKSIRGKIYLMPADFDSLHARYARDFPDQVRPAAGGKAEASSRKLIEFGWDEPDTSFLRRHRDEMERSPFDGCVFHVAARAGDKGVSENFTWLCWGKRRFTPEQFKAAREDLESFSWSRFRHHFLRFNVTPGELDWFDDYDAVVANARLAAELARAGRCDGILLDTEQYQGRLFEFKKQRDAGRRSWDDYASQARRRGREVMTAFQDGYPGLTVLLTFGHSLAWKQSEQGKRPLAEGGYGLLVPFLDGMIEAAKAGTRLVDAYEQSYGYRDANAFERAYRAIKDDAAALAADPTAYSTLR